MLVLLSKSEFDSTTEDIIDWLLLLEEDFVRINGEQFMDVINFNRSETRNRSVISLEYDGRTINTSQIKKKIWLRRRYSAAMFDNIRGALNTVSVDHRTYSNLLKHTMEEYRAYYDLFEEYLATHFELVPNKLQVNKIDMLASARKAGLLIPETLVGNSREQIKEFQQRVNKDIILKPLTDVAHFYADEFIYKMFTAKLSKKDISALDDKFFPVFVQEYIEKEFELRIFYLDGECYSMAIFSQLSNSTSIDFRDFDFRDPVRFVPYKLDSNNYKKIKRFMKMVNLKMGSIDMIKDKTGNFYFLEVNPSGQFGFESLSCNYGLEKKIAEYLIKS
jgi:ATP-GRASP peptide maturase of grasp-with-spasm system